MDQWDDGWTMHTLDQGWSAQFEHTVLITEDGCEVLTKERETSTIEENKIDRAEE